MANINEFQEQLDILKETKTQIKQSIINKGKEVSDVDSFRSYANKIDGIVTLEEGTSDANATADDIVAGKSAYVNGRKVDGNIIEMEGYYSPFIDRIYLGFDNPNLIMESIPFDFNCKIKNGGGIMAVMPFEDVSSAIGLTSDKILTGNTILGLEGTATSDANATTNDIVSGKTAYVNGEKIEGNIIETTSISTNGTDGVEVSTYSLGDDDVLSLAGPYAYVHSSLIRPGNSRISAIAKQVDVANVVGLTSDVLKKGTTILGITGTLEEGIDTSDATATVDDIVSGKTAYVNGEKITGTVYTFQSGEENSQQVSEIVYREGEGAVFALKYTYPGNYMFKTNSGTEIWADLSQIAEAIGLTADKIKKGETILGITGTFEATTEIQGQIEALTQENATLTATINENNVIAEDILGTNS